MHVHDAIKRKVGIDADPGAAESFPMFEALRAELEQHSNAGDVLAPETPEDNHSVQESPTLDIYQTESFAPCSLTCSQEREEAMAQKLILLIPKAILHHNQLVSLEISCYLQLESPVPAYCVSCENAVSV